LIRYEVWGGSAVVEEVTEPCEKFAEAAVYPGRDFGEGRGPE
jgi:hypothetical protein